MNVCKRVLGMVQDLSKFSFGATSAITTSIALIVGLDETSNPKMGIIGALLVIALADNISDSLGIHIYRESQNTGKKVSKIHTLSNFMTRLAVTLMFISLVAVLPIQYAVWSSVVLGLLLLSMLSYLIAISRRTNPLMEVIKHVGVAVIVLAASHFLGNLISRFFRI